VAGFRFNVDTVFANIKTAMTNAGTPGAAGRPHDRRPGAGGHACVKVLIVAGEDVIVPAAGNIPFTTSPIRRRTVTSSAQPGAVEHRPAPRSSCGKNFIVDQAGRA
jgi:hypothetical protein